MAHYERDLTDKDWIGIILRREQSKFLVPNEIIQEAAGQDRGYHEGYVNGSISVHAGHNEIKTGVESDNASLEESLNYLITDPTQFDPDTPPYFNFYGHAPDHEQGVFGQDEMHWKNLTLSLGLRFDHYDLLVDQTGWSPRTGIAVYWPWIKTVFRFSYYRIFQTPPFENLLVASSPAVKSLSDQVLRLPVEPARGNYYQAGFGRAFWGKVELNGNFFWRGYRNYPDDDLLLNTGVSFPITFASANIYGAEAKLAIPHWGRLSGYASYTNLRGGTLRRVAEIQEFEKNGGRLRAMAVIREQERGGGPATGGNATL
jgi:hypothetical protein